MLSGKQAGACHTRYEDGCEHYIRIAACLSLLTHSVQEQHSEEPEEPDHQTNQNTKQKAEEPVEPEEPEEPNIVCAPDIPRATRNPGAAQKT